MVLCKVLFSNWIKKFHIVFLFMINVMSTWRSTRLIIMQSSIDFWIIISIFQADGVNDKSRTKCTLIPGDGVGPELMNAVLDVFEAANIPVDFENYFLSEINHRMSAPLEDVTNSIQRNGICLKVIAHRSWKETDGGTVSS